MTKEQAIHDCRQDLLRIGTIGDKQLYINRTLPILCKYINIENVDMLVKWAREKGISTSRYYDKLWMWSTPSLIGKYGFTQQLAFLLDYLRIENAKMMAAIVNDNKSELPVSIVE